MNRPSEADIRAALEAMHLDYLEGLHQDAGGTGSVLRSTQPGRLMAITLLVQEVFFHRLQSCLIRGQRGDMRAIVFSFLAAMLAMAELWMWSLAERWTHRPIRRRERVIESVATYVEQLC